MPDVGITGVSPIILCARVSRGYPAFKTFLFFRKSQKDMDFVVY